MSAHDGPGNDFKDVFISRGADVFHGYDGYINPDDYERALLRHLAEGSSLWNAHWNAVAEENPTFTIYISFGPPLTCFNKLRLAPLLVDVNAPNSAFFSATISATVQNREDARHTTATNVKAQLIAPPNVFIVGPVVKSTPALTWNNSWTAQWQVFTLFLSGGTKNFDVIVWSDNLGAAVDDFDNPYHKFSISFTPFFVRLEKYLELWKWWELAKKRFADFEEVKQLISLEKVLAQFKSADDVQKDPGSFFGIMLKMAKLESDFGNRFTTSDKVDPKAVRQYLNAVKTKRIYINRLQEGTLKNIKEVLTKLRALQLMINSTALNAFWR
jgi:hypothetical protein